MAEQVSSGLTAGLTSEVCEGPREPFCSLHMAGENLWTAREQTFVVDTARSGSENDASASLIAQFCRAPADLGAYADSNYEWTGKDAGNEDTSQ